MTSTDWVRCGLAVLALALWSCSEKPEPQVGGESHWLAACDSDPECADAELSCVCGSCTRACSTDAMCGGGPKAACFDPDSPLLLQRCEDRTIAGSAGLCLLRCRSDGECGDSRACLEGACVPASPIDAGQPQPPEPPRPSTRDFEDATPTDVAWSRAVALPKPSTMVEGADDRILGTWQEARCDEPHAENDGGWSCARLVLERSASGETTGTFDIRFASLDSKGQGITGPFAAPVDPDVGWPTELAIEEYNQLASGPAQGARYRMLDARFADSTLTFEWSSYDAWHDWCVLQQPFRWEVDGHAFDFCVPQGEAAQEGIDEGKLVLCTSADFEPVCTDSGKRLPCVCLDNSNPHCTPAYCQCDDTACDANMLWRWHARLTLSGEQLVGAWIDDFTMMLPVTLVRVKP